jgi:hypothetical protein
MLRRDLDGGGTNVTQFWGTLYFAAGNIFITRPAPTSPKYHLFAEHVR